MANSTSGRAPPRAAGDSSSGTSFRKFADGLRTGDEAAVGELLARYAQPMLAVARQHLGAKLASKAEPDDAVQSMFGDFCVRLRQGQFELRDWVSLSGLLSLLTLRRCQKRRKWFGAARRDVRRERPLNGIAGSEAFDAEVPDRRPTPEEETMFTDLLEGLLASLPPRDREIVRWVAAGEDAAAVAATVGCTERTVARTLARVGQRLIARPPG